MVVVVGGDISNNGLLRGKEFELSSIVIPNKCKMFPSKYGGEADSPTNENGFYSFPTSSGGSINTQCQMG